jgi:hypothetical protein
MRDRFGVIALVLIWSATALASAARAEEKFPCEAFARLGDGSWQALTTTMIPDRTVRVQEGSLWRPGHVVLGTDVAELLEQKCANAPVAGAAPATNAAAAPAATPQPQMPQTPQIPLSRYADANGTVDVRRLTCGHLDDASVDDTNLLLAWYSGQFSATGKGASINLPRVRYAIRSVIDYCRSNRDKNLAQVMQLMLK